jgi:hypothetical protein
MRVPHPAHAAKIPQGLRVQRRRLMQENEASAPGTAEMMFYMLLLVYILLMVYML